MALRAGERPPPRRRRRLPLPRLDALPSPQAKAHFAAVQHTRVLSGVLRSLLWPRRLQSRTWRARGSLLRLAPNPRLCCCCRMLLNTLLSRSPVALKGSTSGRYLQLRPKDGKWDLCHLLVDDLEGPLEPWRNWERFVIVNAGEGQVCIYCAAHRCYLRIDGQTRKPPLQKVTEIPGDWISERFVVESSQSNDYVSFRSKETGSLLTALGDSSFEIFHHPETTTSSIVPDGLINDMRAGNVVVFLGAGFTLPAGLPTWIGLLKQLKNKATTLRPPVSEELDRLITRGSSECLDQAAQILEDECGKEFFNSAIAEIMQPVDPLPELMAERLRILRELPVKGIITTNVDCVVPGCISNFEPEAAEIRSQLLRAPPKTFQEHILQCGDPKNVVPVPVLQIHGSVNSKEKMVFTRKAYRQLIHGSESFMHFIRSVIAQYTVLYLGFSFGDYYLNDTRSSVLNMLHGDRAASGLPAPIAYAITEGKTEEEQAFFLKHEGTHFINYHAGENWDHSGFETIFRELRKLTSPIVEFGRTLNCSRFLWNDDCSSSWKLLEEFMRRAVVEADGNESDFVVDFVSSAEEALDRVVSNTGKPYDLILTQFGAVKREAHKILRGIKQIQLDRMSASMDAAPTGRSRSVKSCSTLFTDVPAIIVYGMQWDYKDRKNQLTRLGALDYCGWEEGFEPGIIDHNDTRLFAAIYRALSRNIS